MCINQIPVDSDDDDVNFGKDCCVHHDLDQTIAVFVTCLSAKEISH